MIVIAGYGFVGKAHEAVIKDKFNIIIHDPALGYNAQYRQVDAVIVCVSTPQGADGRCNMNNVYDVFSNIRCDVPVLIKSTISLEGWRELKTRFPTHMIAFSPEFLRAATAVEDMTNTKHVILSGDNITFWYKFYKTIFPDARIEAYNLEEAILIKYFRNSFLATKVSFFNEMYDFCAALGVDFNNVRAGVAQDERITESHTFVDTEQRGWGGACFPKDTAALLTMANDADVELKILNTAVDYNKTIRKNLDNQ
jgi:UDPglucose 6-dehydrogenase